MALHDEATIMQHLLDTLAAAANGVVRRLYANLGGDPDLLERHYPTALQPFLTASSVLGAQWYHNSAPDLGFPVRTLPPTPAEKLAASVRWATEHPAPPETKTAVALKRAIPLKRAVPVDDLAGATERHVYDMNRDTITTNAARENVMFARYASATACPFCRVMATRGAVYSSKGVVTDPATGKQKLVVVGARGRPKGTRAIGTDYHDNCKCLAVPVRPGDAYHPPPYVDEWTNQYNTARDTTEGYTLKDIVNTMRRNDYAAANPPAAAQLETAAASEA
jgi:hypothetical protein